MLDDTWQDRKIIFEDMEWLNLHASVLDSVEFVGCEPVEQATWLKLLRFAIGQENSGRITGCKGWKDRKWQQLARCTKREVGADCDLWEWDGDDLLVSFYPVEKETEVQTKREVARVNGSKGGRPRKKPMPEPANYPEKNRDRNPKETDVGFSRETQKAISDKAEGKGIRKGSKERERGREAVDIVSAYPRREKTADALQIVAGHLAEGEDPQKMLAGVKACAEVIASLPSGARNRFVPSALAFFRAKRWADDPETLRRQGEARTGQAQMDLDEAKQQLGGRAAMIDEETV